MTTGALSRALVSVLSHAHASARAPSLGLLSGHACAPSPGLLSGHESFACLLARSLVLSFARSRTRALSLLLSVSPTHPRVAFPPASTSDFLLLLAPFAPFSCLRLPASWQRQATQEHPARDESAHRDFGVGGGGGGGGGATAVQKEYSWGGGSAPHSVGQSLFHGECVKMFYAVTLNVALFAGVAEALVLA